MKSNEDTKTCPSEFLELMRCIYRDASAKCIADVSDLRDLNTIQARVEKEGVSFLTITLPNFCRAFESALQSGSIDPILFSGFRFNRSIPAFLQGMIGLIFDRETGRIYDDQHSSWSSDCSTIIDSIRQICLAFKKVELVCTPARVSATLRNFIAIERSLSLFSLPEEDQAYFSSVSSVLWHDCIATISIDNLLPRHGPGATAERISGNQKFVWHRWHDRLEPFFPVIESAYSLGAYDSEELEKVSIVLPDGEQPVRVVTVPKTLKGPRIIAIEPCCMQYTQQAILRVLVRTLESSRLTAGHVNFSDQSINQELAVVSSKDGQLATIDLSDASDRVPRDLALEMFRSNPDLMDAIDACRSTSAEMPDGEIISPLYKFASMGSALCFPVESMYFYTICIAALLRYHNLPVSYENIKNVSRSVYVYGDDIVVPSIAANSVLEHLQKYNCKVNTSKTFLTGRFRESCGVDAYNGELVTPVYIRKDVPKNRLQASELISWVETANLYYKKGYWLTAALMFCTCESVLGPLPFVSEASSGLGRITFRGFRSIEKWDVDTQQFVMKCWVPRVIYRRDSIDGYPALRKSLSMISARDNSDAVLSIDRLHLEQTARRGAVALSSRWLPAQ